VVCRILLGLGMGGEWASGAALVSETWPASTRTRAMAFMQSSWAVGFGLAALVTGVVLPRWGWRATFFVGIVTAFLTPRIRSAVHEPEIWDQRRDPTPITTKLRQIFCEGMGTVAIFITAMNALALFAWWGMNTWVPAYLVLPVSEGGAGLSVV